MFYMAFQSFSIGQTKADVLHDDHLERDLVAFYAEKMYDIMNFYQAIKQPDAQEFVKAVIKEVEAHIKDNQLEACQAIQSTARYRCIALHMGHALQGTSQPTRSRITRLGSIV